MDAYFPSWQQIVFGTAIFSLSKVFPLFHLVQVQHSSKASSRGGDMNYHPQMTYLLHEAQVHDSFWGLWAFLSCVFTPPSTRINSSFLTRWVSPSCWFCQRFPMTLLSPRWVRCPHSKQMRSPERNSIFFTTLSGMGVRKRGQGYVILRRMYIRYTACTAFYGVTKVKNNVRRVPYCLGLIFVWGEHIGITPNFLPKVLLF